MLRFLKYSLFSVLMMTFMACSAPGTATVAEVIPPTVTPPSKPSTGIPNLPGDIGSIIDSAPSFWGGSINGYTSFYLDKKGFDDEWGWRIRVLRRDNGQTKEFFALSKNNSNGNVVAGDKWTARFFMRNPDWKPGQPKIDTTTVMDFTMEFRSTKEAWVTFNKASGNTSNKTENYGSFGVVAM